MKEIEFLEQMLLIRRSEEKLLELFTQGKIVGTIHTSIGQEACAVGVVSALNKTVDVIFSNHRCHGHLIAYGAPLELLFGEVMGKQIGACAGIGGSQHLQYRNFYSNGIQGGIVPPAIGMALAEKLTNSGAIVAVFLGDGTLGQGAVYESFNLAALWKLPVLFVVEANGYAQSTPTELEHAGQLAERPRAFGIQTCELQVQDPQQVYQTATALVAQVRQNIQPACLVLHTYRLGPHSKGDDLRPRDEIERATQADPLNTMLQKHPAEVVAGAEAKVRKWIEESIDRCLQAEELSLEDFRQLARFEGRNEISRFT